MNDTKLHIRTEYDGSCGIFADENNSMYYARVPSKNIAEHIVKCVNEHDSLVAENKKLRMALAILIDIVKHNLPTLDLSDYTKLIYKDGDENERL